MRLWHVDVKPRGSSRSHGLSVNGWLGKADLGLALCGSGMLIVQPRDSLLVGKHSPTRVNTSI
jgi:hypothetical protein